MTRHTGRTGLLALVCVALLGLGCARTVYVNLHPELPEPSHPQDFETPLGRGWRSFFLYGWVPGSLSIDAAAECFGTEHVERLETRRTFLEGLVASFAGFYINVYSPYNARAVCDHSKLPGAEPPQAEVEALPDAP